MSCPKLSSCGVGDKNPHPQTLSPVLFSFICPLLPLLISNLPPTEIKTPLLSKLRKSRATNGTESGLRVPFPTNKSRHVSRNRDSVETGCGFSLTGKMICQLKRAAPLGTGNQGVPEESFTSRHLGGGGCWAGGCWFAAQVY